MSDHGEPITPKTEVSDYPLMDDHHPFGTNGGLMDQSRAHNFPLLGLQGKRFKETYLLIRLDEF